MNAYSGKIRLIFASMSFWVLRSSAVTNVPSFFSIQETLAWPLRRRTPARYTTALTASIWEVSIFTFFNLEAPFKMTPPWIAKSVPDRHYVEVRV